MGGNRAKWGATASLAVIVGLVAAVLQGPGADAQSTAAAAPAELSGSSFTPGYIIDDSKMYDPNAMTAAEIQAFIDSRVQCAPGATCLANYVQSTRTIGATPMCSQYDGAANESAAMIIYKVQRACGVSAKALLVMLQKEQGLVTSRAPSNYAFRSAMGAGCPDTAPCDADYYGFFDQMQYGAYLLKRYTQPAGTGPGTEYTTRYDLRYPVGSTSNVLFNPNPACGAGPVYISNQATHALYIYTPYQPNGAALNNLYGTGDGCSSYGNRNFWVYYSNWFGPTTGNDQPIGNVDSVTSDAAGVAVSGWVLDPNTTDSIDVKILVDGVQVRQITASGSRPDVGRAYPGQSDKHGYSTVLDLADGTRTVCIYGVNVGVGADSLLGCRTVDVRRQLPWGRVDSSRLTDAGLGLSGWAMDPNTTDPVWLHVYDDDAFVQGVYADGSRPDVGGAYRNGDRRGFSFDLALPAGPHNVCVYGLNVGPGSNTLLECRVYTVPTATPRGYIDQWSVSSAGLSVAGWSLDPSVMNSTWLHVYVNGAFVTGVLADRQRTDLAAPFPRAGSAHGFGFDLPLPTGSQRVCLYGLNVGADRSVELACRTVAVPAPAVLGSLDAISVQAGGIRAEGWTLQEASTTATYVHVYDDGRFVDGYLADRARPDVAAAYPSAGAQHGFAADVPASTGSHQVCVYGLSVTTTSSKLLGCRTVVVP